MFILDSRVPNEDLEAHERGDEREHAGYCQG
jgi:hypothetical protein